MNNYQPNWKLFWTTFIIIFLSVSLHLLGIKTPQLINPLGLKPIAQIAHPL